MPQEVETDGEREGAEVKDKLQSWSEEIMRGMNEKRFVTDREGETFGPNEDNRTSQSQKRVYWPELNSLDVETEARLPEL